MATQPIGITFAPTPDQAEMGQKNFALQGGSPEAIQILSLHLPKFLGARPLAPNDLLTAKSTNPGSAVVDSILRDMGLLPQQATGQARGGAPSETGSLADMLRQATGGGQRFEPTPNVIPGIGPGEPPPGTLPSVQREIPPPTVQDQPQYLGPIFPPEGMGTPFGAASRKPWERSGF